MYCLQLYQWKPSIILITCAEYDLAFMGKLLENIAPFSNNFLWILWTPSFNKFQIRRILNIVCGWTPNELYDNDASVISVFPIRESEQAFKYIDLHLSSLLEVEIFFYIQSSVCRLFTKEIRLVYNNTDLKWVANQICWRPDTWLDLDELGLSIWRHQLIDLSL